jgi:hypothetical protein
VYENQNQFSKRRSPAPHLPSPEIGPDRRIKMLERCGRPAEDGAPEVFWKCGEKI